MLISGRDLETSEYNSLNKGLPYITGASNIVDGQILINRWVENPKVISELDDLLISCKGTIGKTAINDIGDCHIARQIMSIRLFFHQQLQLMENQKRYLFLKRHQPILKILTGKAS